MSTWREAARPIIARVLAETQGQEENAIRKALHDAYPWCSREGFPYKVWCSEIQSQRGTYKTKGQRNQESQKHSRGLFPLGDRGMLSALPKAFILLSFLWYCLL